LERALEEMRTFGFDFERPKRRPLLDALRGWAEMQAPDMHPGRER
jgi:hypothetical protein